MRILFVCTGNTCRSPMAEAIARQVAEERGLTDVVVSSAGTGAFEGSTASDGALLIGMEHGTDLAGHRAQQLTRETVAEVDVILVMAPQHLLRVRELGGEGKAFLLTDFASHGNSTRAVSDPFGGDLETYRATYEELEREIRRVFDRLVPQSAPPAGGGGGPAST
jgi:protein-tyrosine-phosphatase